MDDDVRTKVLHFHNGLRYALVQGTSPGYEGKDLPPAKSLYKMRWSCALEEKALKLTKNCSHSVSESLDNGQMFTIPTMESTFPKKVKMLSFMMRCIGGPCQPSITS
ncbi:hypothetical protein OSTOST_17684 [Ostertagia ostertagi]